jgi:hypothetical protein
MFSILQPGLIYYQSVVNNPSPLIPAMTSYTTPSGVVSSNHVQDIYGGALPWWGVDGNEAHPWYGGSATYLPVWLQYQFPTNHVVTSYKVWFPLIYGVPSEESAGHYTLQGSTNGTDWTILDTQVTNNSSLITLSNPTPYSYYRIYVTQITHIYLPPYAFNSGTYLGFQLYGI